MEVRKSLLYYGLLVIKTHGSESRGQEKQPAQLLPRVYYTRRDCVQKTDNKTNLSTTRILSLSIIQTSNRSTSS